MNTIIINSIEFPGLYISADQAALDAQKNYFRGLRWYLILLVAAAFISYSHPNDILGALLSATLFLATLGILVLIRVKKPDDIWYNGRAVAESVKTISWRWMMRAEPYEDCENLEIVSTLFIKDLQKILNQNRSLSQALQPANAISDPISPKMKTIRALPVSERLDVYVKCRIHNQATWYLEKANFNKTKANQWFYISVFLHTVAALMLIYKINNLEISLPVEVVATAAGAALTWLQAKKHNELNSAYSLATHEIALIKGESHSVHTESQLCEFVVNSESAFSREHTQWVARKGD